MNGPKPKRGQRSRRRMASSWSIGPKRQPARGQRWKRVRSWQAVNAKRRNGCWPLQPLGEPRPTGKLKRSRVSVSRSKLRRPPLPQTACARTRRPRSGRTDAARPRRGHGSRPRTESSWSTGPKRRRKRAQMPKRRRSPGCASAKPANGRWPLRPRQEPKPKQQPKPLCASTPKKSAVCTRRRKRASRRKNMRKSLRRSVRAPMRSRPMRSRPMLRVQGAQRETEARVAAERRAGEERAAADKRARKGSRRARGSGTGTAAREQERVPLQLLAEEREVAELAANQAAAARASAERGTAGGDRGACGNGARQTGLMRAWWSSGRLSIRQRCGGIRSNGSPRRRKGSCWRRKRRCARPRSGRGSRGRQLWLRSNGARLWPGAPRLPASAGSLRVRASAPAGAGFPGRRRSPRSPPLCARGRRERALATTGCAEGRGIFARTGGGSAWNSCGTSGGSGRAAAEDRRRFCGGLRPVRRQWGAADLTRA